MSGRSFVPNKHRAVATAKIATIKNGRRVIRDYKSGDALVGHIPEDDAPPFTGFVRGWFKEREKK